MPIDSLDAPGGCGCSSDLLLSQIDGQLRAIEQSQGSDYLPEQLHGNPRLSSHQPGQVSRELKVSAQNHVDKLLHKRFTFIWNAQVLER
jgi:hypothetical protein